MSLPQVDESAEHAAEKKMRPAGNVLEKALMLGDDVLRARGLYSTLSKERRQQLERVQNICTTLITNSQAALRDCEVMPPASTGPIDLIEKCLTNLKDARERITNLSNEMIVLKPSAWPE